MYDPSGESNLTEGIKPNNKGGFIVDANQEPKFTAQRKHSRTLQGARCSVYFA